MLPTFAVGDVVHRKGIDERCAVVRVLKAANGKGFVYEIKILTRIPQLSMPVEEDNLELLQKGGKPPVSPTETEEPLTAKSMRDLFAFVQPLPKKQPKFQIGDLVAKKGDSIGRASGGIITACAWEHGYVYRVLLYNLVDYAVLNGRREDALKVYPEQKLRLVD